MKRKLRKFAAAMYKAWMSFSLLVGGIMTKIILSILFYLVIAPIGLLKKLFVYDSLGLKFDSGLDTYWIKKEPPKGEMRYYERQF